MRSRNKDRKACRTRCRKELVTCRFTMLKHVETPLKLHSFGAKPTFLFFFSREAAVRRFAKSLTVLEECSGSGAGTLCRTRGY